MREYAGIAILCGSSQNMRKNMRSHNRIFPGGLNYEVLSSASTVTRTIISRLNEVLSRPRPNTFETEPKPG